MGTGRALNSIIIIIRRGLFTCHHNKRVKIIGFVTIFRNFYNLNYTCTSPTGVNFGLFRSAAGGFYTFVRVIKVFVHTFIVRFSTTDRKIHVKLCFMSTCVYNFERTDVTDTTLKSTYIHIIQAIILLVYVVYGQLKKNQLTEILYIINTLAFGF